MKQPTPDEIRQARRAAGITQTEAGELVHASLRGWQNWEGAIHAMPLAAWELFLIKTNKETPYDSRTAPN